MYLVNFKIDILYIPINMQFLPILSCFVVVWHWSILPVSFRVASLPLGAIDFPCAQWGNLKNTVNVSQNSTQKCWYNGQKKINEEYIDIFQEILHMTISHEITESTLRQVQRPALL